MWLQFALNLKKFRFDSAKEKQVILLNGFVICIQILASTSILSMTYFDPLNNKSIEIL